MGKLPVPVLSYDQIRERADQFLRKHHPSGELPIPIEDIIDVTLRVDIVAIPGLLKTFELDGFTTSDLQSICVDDFVYNNRQTRYRFTLAHEMGHIVLHRDVFESVEIRKIADWKRFLKTMSEDDRGWFEFQANSFAGLVLVPRPALVREHPKCVSLVKKHGGQIARQPEAAQSFVEECLGKRFDVSPEVISRRLNKEHLAWPGK